MIALAADTMSRQPVEALTARQLADLAEYALLDNDGGRWRIVAANALGELVRRAADLDPAPDGGDR